MSYEPSLWSNLHGAATHFPIALMLLAAFCDCASLVLRNDELRRGFHFTATIALIVGALVSYVAVLSGLVVSRWRFWGHATLLHHHQFVWPAFAMMTLLAVWRAVKWEVSSRAHASAASVALSVFTALLVSGAGYWGGELLNQG